MKKYLLPILLFIMFIPFVVEALDYKESFRTELESIGYDEMFMMNVKENNDGNFIGVAYNLWGGKAIVKFDKNGRYLNSISYEQFPNNTTGPISDVIELETGQFLITIDMNNSNNNESGYTYICDNNLENCNRLDLDSMNHPTGKSIFEFNGHYMIIGASNYTTNDGKYNLYLTEIDNSGNLINNRSIEKQFGNGYYYGVYSDGQTLYVMLSNDGTFEILEVTSTEIKTRTIKNDTTDEIYNHITEGVYTEMVVDDNNNLYFSTTYGIYKFDKNDNLSLVVDAEKNKLDFTSIIRVDEYFIAGGIKKVEIDDQEYPSAMYIVYDNNFDVVEVQNLNDTFEKGLSNEFDKFSITKQISKTKKGFLLSGMLNGEPFAIEYELPFKIYTKIDGNGTIEVVNSAYGGDNITFKVSAKKGLKLAGLTITTDSGEVLQFNEEDLTTNSDGTISISTNKFTMPYENVTIEARWTSGIINPNTGTGISIITVMTVLLVSSFTYMMLKRKENYIIK